MEDQPTSLLQLPFSWSAVRYADPNTKRQSQRNETHLKMNEPFAMKYWSKPAGYILCASPVTTRDPQHWQVVEGGVTCQSCLGRVTWFQERYALLQKKAKKGE